MASQLDLVTVPAKLRSYYHHSVWMKDGAGLPWVAASGVEGMESIRLRGLRPGNYRVRLIFANPTADERCFDIKLQGRTVSTDFSSGDKLRTVVMAFDGIVSEGSLQIALEAKKGATQLSGIEIVPMAPEE